MSRSDSGVDNRKYSSGSRGPWLSLLGHFWVNFGSILGQFLGPNFGFIWFLRSFEVIFVVTGLFGSFEVKLNFPFLARYLIQDDIRRHLEENGRMGAALRRLDAGRMDGRRYLPSPSFRIPDLRSGHHRDRDLRTVRGNSDGDNNPNHVNNNNINDNNINNNTDGNNNERPPSPSRPSPPTAPPTHEVRRQYTAKWLTMGYKEILADLMT